MTFSITNLVSSKHFALEDYHYVINTSIFCFPNMQHPFQDVKKLTCFCVDVHDEKLICYN